MRKISYLKSIILVSVMLLLSLKWVFAFDYSAPDFVLKNIEDKNISLSDYKGKEVILFFWSTWCPYCVKELKKINNDSYDLKGAEILLIDVGESPEVVRRFLKKNSFDIKPLLDMDMQVSYDYGLIGLPTFFVVDSSGKIIYMDNVFPEDSIK